MQAGVIPGRPGAARSIAARDLTSGAEEVVVNNVGNNIEIRAFALSPDGRWLAFVRPGRQEAPHLFVLPVSGGEARPVSTAVGDWRIGPVSIAWSRDSRFVVVSKQLDNDGGSEIWQVPLDGSEPRNTGIRLPEGVSRIDVSPDGRRVALSKASVRTETWVLQNIPPQK